jgi:hypothetical protein
MVERQIVVLDVAGSSPVAHPRFSASSSKIFAVLRRGVAQLVAHSLWERGVAGSSPAAPTTFFYIFFRARSSGG